MQYKKLRFVRTQNIEQGIDMIVVQKLALLIYSFIVVEETKICSFQWPKSI
jgi:hypothetical protein